VAVQIILQLGMSRSNKDGPQRWYTSTSSTSPNRVWQAIWTDNLAPVVGSHRIGDDLVYDLCSRKRRGDSSTRYLAGPNKTLLNLLGVGLEAYAPELRQPKEAIFAQPGVRA